MYIMGYSNWILLAASILIGVLFGAYTVTADDIGDISKDPDDTDDVWLRLRTDIIGGTKYSRRRRQAGGLNIYQQLASMSGGTVFMTDKLNIGAVADIIKETFTGHLVTLMNFRLPAGSTSSFKIPVDKTLADVTIKLQTVRHAAIATINRPSGSPEPFSSTAYSKQTLGRKLVIYKINASKPTDYGEWTFVRGGTEDWEVVVTGQSQLDFTYQMLEPGPGGYGDYPVKGRPIAGQSVKLSVNVPHYDLVQSVNSVVFLNDQGTQLGKVDLRNVGGRRGKSKFISNSTKIPDNGFKLAIEGVDKNGHSFIRLDPPTVLPLTISLEVPLHVGIIHVTETLEVPYNVTNTGTKPLSVKIQITDSELFSQAPTQVTKTIPAGSSVINKFRLIAGNTVGVTTTLTVTATISGSTSGQYEVRRLTVKEKEKSTTTTTTTTTPTTPTTKPLKTTIATSKTNMAPVSTRKLSNASNGTTTQVTTTTMKNDDKDILTTKLLVFGGIIAFIGCVVPIVTIVIITKTQSSMIRNKIRSQELDIEQTELRRARVNNWM